MFVPIVVRMFREYHMIPKEIKGIGFTPIEKEILERLCDGEPKTLKEMAVNEWQDESVVKQHIHYIRKKIDCSRFRIYSGYENGQLVYRLVMLLPCSS